jgi:hypothetical protein
VRRLLPCERHRRFAARLRRARSLSSVGSATRTLKLTRIGARSFQTLFLFSLQTRRHLVAPLSFVRSPGGGTLVRVEGLRSERERHACTRIQTHRVERTERTVFERPVSMALSRATIGPARSQRQEARAQFPRVPLTMSRAPSPAPASQPAAAIAQAHEAHCAGTTPREITAAARPLPAHELSRVTEHVLRTLDRRVLSYRERTGQI